MTTLPTGRSTACAPTQPGSAATESSATAYTTHRRLSMDASLKSASLPPRKEVDVVSGGGTDIPYQTHRGVSRRSSRPDTAVAAWSGVRLGCGDEFSSATATAVRPA